MSLHKIKDGLWIRPEEITSIKAMTVTRAATDSVSVKAILQGEKATGKTVHIVVTAYGERSGYPEDFDTIEEARAHADLLAEKVNALSGLPIERRIEGRGRPALLKVNCATGEVQPVPDHQVRIYEEKSELDSRRERLARFIDRSPMFEGLPEAARDRLKEQRRIMGDYSAILGERIAAF